MQVAFTKTVQPREQKRDGRRLKNLSMGEKLPAQQERGGGTEAAPTWVTSVIHSTGGQVPQRHSFGSERVLTVLSVLRNSPESPSLSRYCFLAFGCSNSARTVLLNYQSQEDYRRATNPNGTEILCFQPFTFIKVIFRGTQPFVLHACTKKSRTPMGPSSVDQYRPK